MGVLKNENKIMQFTEHAVRWQNRKREPCDGDGSVNKMELIEFLIDEFDIPRNNLHNYGNAQHIDIIERSKKVLELKIKNCIPKHIIIYMILTSFALGATLSALIVQIILNVKLIDYYVLLIIATMSLGLLRTSIKLLAEWKEFLNHNVQEKKRFKNKEGK